jgi:hypothetical protein
MLNEGSGIVNESSEEKRRREWQESIQSYGGWGGYVKYALISIAIAALCSGAFLALVLHFRLQSLHAYALNAGTSLGLLILGMLAGKKAKYWEFALLIAFMTAVMPWADRLTGQYSHRDVNMWLLTLPPIAAPFVGFALYRLLRLLRPRGIVHE